MWREEKVRMRAWRSRWTLGFLGVLTAALTTGAAPPDPRRALDPDDIGGVVRGPHGPEAGVWVVAETSDLPPRFVRIVVTGADGRYVLPDLPEARYQVWVRGYGLVDSPRVAGTRGATLDLTAVAAPDQKA